MTRQGIATWPIIVLSSLLFVIGIILCSIADPIAPLGPSSSPTPSPYKKSNSSYYSYYTDESGTFNDYNYYYQMNAVGTAFLVLGVFGFFASILLLVVQSMCLQACVKHRVSFRMSTPRWHACFPLPDTVITFKVAERPDDAKLAEWVYGSLKGSSESSYALAHLLLGDRVNLPFTATAQRNV